jgi:hypothetical protein
MVKALNLHCYQAMTMQTGVQIGMSKKEHEEKFHLYPSVIVSIVPNFW